MSKKNQFKVFISDFQLETGSCDMGYVHRSEELLDDIFIEFRVLSHIAKVRLTLTEAATLLDALAEVLDEARKLNEATTVKLEKRQRALTNAARRQAGLPPLKKGAAQ